jgi:hypothetical protein
MTSCLLCSAEVYYRDGCRNKYLTDFCSRYCFELSKQGLPISTQKLKVNCSMCGSIFSIVNHFNTQHSWLCSTRCRQRKDTIFGRKSLKKYAMLMMLKVNGPLSSQEISVHLVHAFPSFSRLSPTAVSSQMRAFIIRGGVRKISPGYFELVYDMPLEQLASPTLID